MTSGAVALAVRDHQSWHSFMTTGDLFQQHLISTAFICHLTLVKKIKKINQVDIKSLKVR